MATQRKPRRQSLISTIIRKAGLPDEKTQSGYLSRRQLQALLVFIETKEEELRRAYQSIETN